MTRADLCSAVAGIAKVMARSHQAHAELAGAFLILAEALVECGSSDSLQKQQPSRAQERLKRLARLESAMTQRTPAERRDAVMQAFGITSRSRYFELRRAAVAQGLLRQSGESGKKTGLSDCASSEVESRS